MRILYFDIFAGISGHMTLGAFLDLGVREEKLKSELKKLDFNGYKIEVNKKAKNGIMCTEVNILLDDKENTYNNSKLHIYRSFSDVKGLIEKSNLHNRVKELSLKMFYNIAKAESKIHGKDLEEIHFNELGEIDSIIDIVGVAICFNELKVDKVIASSMNIGMGVVKYQHGVIPVPTPATLEIIKDNNIPIYNTGIKKENVTLTGAIIVATLVEEFGDIPNGIIKAIGYGAGKRDMDVANMLRLILIENEDNALVIDKIWVIETNVDDMTGEVAGYAFERILEAGALDVYYTPIFMKKNRPAFKLSVICRECDLENIKMVILKETSTIGMRMYKVHREIMNRTIKTVKTELGEARVKVCTWGDIQKSMPEYEDCKKLALQHNMSIIDVYNYIKNM